MNGDVYQKDGQYKCDVDEHTTVCTNTLKEMEDILDWIENAHLQECERRVQGDSNWHQLWKHPS